MPHPAWANKVRHILRVLLSPSLLLEEGPQVAFVWFMTWPGSVFFSYVNPLALSWFYLTHSGLFLFSIPLPTAVCCTLDHGGC